MGFAYKAKTRIASRGVRLSDWTNPCSSAFLERAKQGRAYRSGEALQSHIDAVHGGKVDDACPACLEIAMKMKAA